jgi:hypothetical protein
MATTFAGANIGALRNDDDLATFPGFVTPSFVVRRPYPGGDDESLQMIGTGRPTAVFDLHLTSAEYAALLALMQTEGTLILGADTYTNATLTALTDVVVLINGDRRCRGEFVLTTGA